MSASFYAVVESGSANGQSVIEINLSGLAGYIWFAWANRAGMMVDGESVGRSLPYSSGAIFFPEYRLYLNPPELAAYDEPAVISVNAFDFDGWFGGGSGSCDMLVPGVGAAISPLVIPATVLWLDLPVLALVTVLVLGFLYVSPRGVKKTEASILLAIYAGYAYMRLLM